MYKIKPVISEKSIDLAKKKKFTLSVPRDLNKNQIRQIINEIFGLEVKDINVININPRKEKKNRGIVHKSGVKKAIVRIKGDKTFPGFEIIEEEKKKSKKKRSEEKSD